LSLEELKELALRIKDERLREVVLGLLEKPVLSFTSSKPIISLEESPAAPRKHHFFKGGLLLHTLSVAKLALAIADVLEGIYGISVDRDLVIASAILHDLFKYYQYAPDEVFGGYKTREDWYLGHDYAVVAELVARGSPEKLVRALSEVHGQVPFSTMEGLVVHLADSVDARLGEILQNMLISRLKEYEAEQCQLYKAINNLVEKHGFSGLLRAMQSNMQELKALVEEECRRMSTLTGPK